MNCPYCGKAHPDGAGFCPSTGKSLSFTKSCPHCGESHPSSMQFCPKSGKEISLKPKSTKPKRKSKVWIVILLLIVLSLGASGMWAIGSGAINIPFLPLTESVLSTPTEELIEPSPTIEPSRTPLPISSPTIDQNSISTIVASTVEAQLTQSAVSDVITTQITLPPRNTSSQKVQIRWFVGLGTGTSPEQISIQERVVADFNNTHDNIELILEIVPYDIARDTLAAQIASGNGPDIIGPVGWGGSNAFYGQWLDIGPYIEATGFDTSIFDPALVDFYQTEEGQVSLPFAVFPGAIYYVPSMFDKAGLAYPPQRYGEQYQFDGQWVDWNWDTVTEVAKRLTIDTNGYNATESGFNRNKIVQIGYVPQWQHPNSIATFFGAAKIYGQDVSGRYVTTIPDIWKEAWRWYYDGMWGAEPFIATGTLSSSPEFGNGNLFNTGKAAMALTQTWYTCCLGDFRNSGYKFQVGIQPMSRDGVVHGRIDADTFRIWKGTKNPWEAFEVLTYLITTGGDKLLPIYGAMPAIESKTDAFFAQKSREYPFVTQSSWNVFIQGLSYPDTPSAEQYMPNWNEANVRIQIFGDLLQNTPPSQLNFEREWQKLVSDLNQIINK